MDKEQLTFLRRLRRALEDRALEPNEPVRVRIHETLDSEDPVLILRNNILQADGESLLLFSGFQGSGKTTELFRLRRLLRDQDYVVLYADAMEYLAETEPLTLSDMLMLLAAAFGSALAQQTDIKVQLPSYWDRLRAFVEGLEIRIEKIGASVGYTSPGARLLGAFKLGVDIKAELRTPSNFRDDLKTFLSSHLPALQRDVEAYIRDGVAAIRAARGQDTQVVFIVDQLERMRGNYQNWHEVIRAGRQVFGDQRDRLRLPDVHCVYSVPSWLALLTPHPSSLVILPSVHLWEKGERKRRETAWSMFHALVRQRIPPAHLARLFGPNPDARDGPVERLIEASGGNIRALLQLLREVLARADVLPVESGPATSGLVSSGAVDRVIANKKESIGLLSKEDARLLYSIQRTQGLEGIESKTPETIERLSLFLNETTVLYFRNGIGWFDIHPLIRNDVIRLGKPDTAV